MDTCDVLLIRVAHCFPGSHGGYYYNQMTLFDHYHKTALPLVMHCNIEKQASRVVCLLRQRGQAAYPNIGAEDGLQASTK